MHTVKIYLPTRRCWHSPAAAVLLALAMITPALGQDGPANPPTPPALPPVPVEPAPKEEIVVLDSYQITGSFQSSLAAAAHIKGKHAAIVEVVASEDIGKLPDVSIADSLTRLTGLTTQRTNGRSQGISIRGLSGDYSTGLLNGREQVSTGENRAVEFDQYPGELLSGVIVYKTSAASLTGQGLAGTIDMETVKPLNKSNRLIAVNGYYDWTQYSQLTPGTKAKGNRFNVSYVDQLANKTVGIAFGFHHSSKPYQGKQFQAWGYPTDTNGAYALGGTKSYVRSSNLDRDGFMAVIEYKPNENLHSTIDIYYSQFEEKQLLRGMEIPLAFWSGAVLTPGYTVNNGLITNARLTNVQPVVRNDVFKRNDSPIAIGWNLKIGENSSWPIVFDAGYSKIVRTDINLETYSGLGFRGTTTTPDTMTVQLIPGQIPVIKSTLDYANGSILRLSDPQGWGPTTLPGGGMYGYSKHFRAKDELGQFKLSTRHELPIIFKDVELGVSYTKRYKRDGENPSGYLNSPSGSNTMALPAQIGTSDMGFLGLGRIYAYDPLAAQDAGVWGFTQNSSTDMVSNTFAVTEKIAQVYAQFNISNKIGSIPMKGNLGFLAINADQFSKGYSVSGGLLNAVSGGAKYTNFAPSLNLNFEVAEEMFLRFSVARQVARPRMFDMKASQSWSYDATLATSTDLSHGPWGASGGNTELRPWLADSIDISVEKYFSENRGYISLAAFHKNLISYIYTQSVLEDFSGYPIRNGAAPVLLQGVSSQPANGRGGKIQGLEFTWSLPSELISKSIKGFGIVLEGAYTESKVKPWGPTGGDAAIAGLARKVGNVTIYYERKGFSARISERYRSKTREYITTFGPPNRAGDNNSGSGYTLAQPEKVVDAQVSYGFQEGKLKGLAFYVQAYNLNDEPLITYNNGDARQVINYQKYGSSYSLGVAYKF